MQGISETVSRVSSFDMATVLSRPAADGLRAMLDRRFPGLLQQRQWRLRSSSGRNIVLDLESNFPDAYPRSMIVKCPTPQAGSVARNNHEVAGMQFLRSLPAGDLTSLAPEVYAHDPTQGIFAMENLEVSRGARRLADVLRSANSRDASASLQTLARALGRLHRHTFGWQANGNGGSGEHRSWLMPDFARTITILRGKLKKFGSALDSAGLDELRQIDQLLHRDGVWAWCHGDVSPENVFVSADGVHLCDFESTGFRHPILEGVHSGWIFPLSPGAGGIPEDVIDGMKAAYRREFDLKRMIGREPEKAEAAAVIVFLLYHWVYTFPEVGLPIAYAGSAAKIPELMRLLRASSSAVHFPNVTRHLLHLDRSLRQEPSLGPGYSILYECFRGRPSGTPPVAKSEDARGDGPLRRVAGIYRVNRSCHLVIRERDSRSLGVYILEYPHIRCAAIRTDNITFRGIEMPLELTRTAPSEVTIRDLRTDRTIQIRRQRISVAALRHLRQLRDISRYHRAMAPAGSA